MSSTPLAHPRPLRRFAVRWALAYLVVYLSEAVEYLIAYLLFAAQAFTTSSHGYTRLWEALPMWVGTHLLGLSPNVMTRAVGMSPLFIAVKFVVMLIIAAVIALIWIWIENRRDRKLMAADSVDIRQRSERRDAALHDVLRVCVRYAVGIIMLGYGASKIIKTQFHSPRLEALATPLGQIAPNDLMWMFMGYSYGYNLFTGLGEFVGALLLFFRRTTTLGALLIIAIMSNVVVMDYVYNVGSVTLWAAAILLMAVFLVLPDVRRLINVFVLNRPTEAVDLGPPYGGRWVRPARTAAKVLALVIAVVQLQMSWQQLHTSGDLAPKPALYGAYDVDQFVFNGDSTPPLVTDSTHWRQASVSRTYAGGPAMFAVHVPDGTVQRYAVRIDTVARRLYLSEFPNFRITSPAQLDSIPVLGAFTYTRADGNRLAMTGVLKGDSIQAQFHRIDQTYRLLNPVRWFRISGD